MDNTIIAIGFAIIFLLSSMVYVTLTNRRKNQEREDELETYKKQLNRLDEQLSREEISKNTYEILRKNLEEQHQITFRQSYR
jgi:5-bromo-4-chloroindolyl phosphate hydrolysis protein